MSLLRAFAATGVLEYAYYLFNNQKVVSLSEQEIVVSFLQ